MKALKTILISVYVIIIILLLLSLLRCRNDVPQHTDIIPKPVIKEKFKADVVMCIDCTSSMNNIINTIRSMRIRVIGFRDVGDTTPFEKSEFYNIPDRKDDFKNFVSHLLPVGGGDDPEHGYDALAMAINSDWRKEKDVHQIIILWTDNASHPLSGMNGVPASVEELKSQWNEKMNNKGKRLVLFAPLDVSWTELEKTWNNTTRHDESTGGALSDVDYEDILKTLSERI